MVGGDVCPEVRARRRQDALPLDREHARLAQPP